VEFSGDKIIGEKSDMLILENLSKNYILPNKSRVIALDGVSMRFGDRGLAFIVGKSGCGKSTLLNILGGLDKFDSGEFLFKGKSIKSFSDREYEDYRNHNVGFVFQESNLLDSFTVEENLALAVELQGKTADKTKIDEILRSVGLEGIADRKVTALSGGQKQRVAVARALIKNSDIILADEPTGNLDSGSAKELFEILKKISEDKLVIVVSHDVESANLYGDRIIEMSDGKVIKDGNAPETSEDAEKGANEKKAKSGRLKFPKMLKLSARNLRTRVIRLVVMILLFSVSLGFFGMCLSAYSMDIVKIYDKAYKNLGSKSHTINWVEIGQYSNGDTNRYFTQEEVNDIEGKLGYKTLPLYYPCENEPLVRVEKQAPNRGDDDYASFYRTDSRTSGFVCLDGVDLSEYGLEVIAGKLPENGNEIAIPYYVFLLYQKFGVANDTECDYDTPEKIIGKTAYYLNAYRTIVGVVATGMDLSKYEELKTPYKDIAMSMRKYIALNGNFGNELFRSLHTAIFINSEMFNVASTLYSYTFPQFAHTVSGEVYRAEEVDGIQFINWKKKVLPGEIAISRRELLEEMYINQTGLSPVEFEVLWQNGEFDQMDVFELLKKLSGERFTVTRIIRDTVSGRDAEPKEFRVVGITAEDKTACISDKDFSAYWLPPENCVIGLAVGCAKNPERYPYLAEIAGKAALAYGDDSIKKVELLNVNSAICDDIENVEYQKRGFIKLGLLGGILFCVFSVIMMLNFFIVTIKDKRKDIGILLALGTGKNTIFAIYFIEALIVSLISALIGIGFTSLINRVLEALIFFVPFRVLRNSFLGVAMTFALSLFVAFVGSAAPIFAISRHKPAEIIRS